MLSKGLQNVVQVYADYLKQELWLQSTLEGGNANQEGSIQSSPE